MLELLVLWAAHRGAGGVLGAQTARLGVQRGGALAQPQQLLLPALALVPVVGAARRGAVLALALAHALAVVRRGLRRRALQVLVQRRGGLRAGSGVGGQHRRRGRHRPARGPVLLLLVPQLSGRDRGGGVDALRGSTVQALLLVLAGGRVAAAVELRGELVAVLGRDDQVAAGVVAHHAQALLLSFGAAAQLLAELVLESSLRLERELSVGIKV